MSTKCTNGVNFEGKEMGPSKRDHMLRMGLPNSARNHAELIEVVGKAAMFNDGAGARNEDEIMDGAAGGGASGSGDINLCSGKLTVVADDFLYTNSAASFQHITNMSRVMHETVNKLQKTGTVEKDKSTRRAIMKNVGRINRVSQQAILKALSLD